MKHKRGLLMTLAVLVALCAVCGLWLNRQQQQDARNRQLIAALEGNDTATALTLVNAGADPNTRSGPLPTRTFKSLLFRLMHQSLPVNNNPTAFHIACGASIPGTDVLNASEDVRLLQAMLAHGANANEQLSNRFSALHFAVLLCRLHTAELLLQHSANVNAQDSHGQTPLMLAAFRNRVDITHLLLMYGANPNLQALGKGPLHYAIIFGAGASVVSELLSHGADPNLRDPTGNTVLRLAQQKGRTDLVRLLKQHGAR